MNSSAKNSRIGSLHRAAGRADRRLRWVALLKRLARVLPALLVIAVVALTAIKVLRPGARIERELVLAWLGLVAVGLVWVVVAYFRRVGTLAGAQKLDVHHGLKNRLTNAITFAELPDGERTPMTELAIADALEHGRKLDPKGAVPIPIPREFAVVGFLILALFGISKLEVRHLRHVPPPPPPAAALLTDDDLSLFRDRLEELKQANKNGEELASVGRYNALLEDIAARRVDREEVFRRLADIERELSKDLEADQEALDEGLKSLAQELEKSSLTRPAAEALEQKRLADAEKAFRDLAEKLKRKTQKPTPGELEKLRKALERASQAANERVASIDRERQALQAERESLLKRKADGGAANEQKLAENQRRLEKLDREKSRAERAQKQMDALDKQIAEAARQLMKEMGESAKSLEKGAEDLNRMAQKDLTTEQKKALLKRLEELREVMRQQGQGGKEQLERLKRFSQRARGQSGSGEGEDGQGQGQGKPGSGKGQPRLGSGQGSGQGVEIEMGQSQGSGQGDGSGGAPGSGQKGASTGHDPNVSGDPTAIKGQVHDVTAAGVDTGQGSASSEVIYGAAARGFGSKAYKDVFVQYEGVAEQDIDKDDIPPGYRFYVRRYFQLIRPRE